MISVALAAVGANLCALVYQPTSEHREVLGDRWKWGHGLIHISTIWSLTEAIFFCLVVRETHISTALSGTAAIFCLVSVVGLQARIDAATRSVPERGKFYNVDGAESTF
ncbi:hypothetical protein G6O67_001982 [Ophiocordyceps sinensis]|uniref:Uncharacterized protein n=2 Tax=Ophiocordyceps sinensis TaxID=72228 RepID=A0A8H4PTB4_9HYPO|nr:hypothetical protein OCS_05776 [Ophiocordyceps sinensis CO18]KAF4510057.1 hypothetical protein G6O67_001982 [Ophiocordyceps sinensis]